MDPENLSEKYQLLLQENRLLKERVSLLEAALKRADMPLVEGTHGDYITTSPMAAQRKSSSIDTQEKPIPTLNKYSSPTDKIRLYMSLFKGREDVYAHKYFNKKEGKHAYGPMKRKPWEQTQGDGLYAPFDEHVVDHHLRGFDGMIAGVVSDLSG